MKYVGEITLALGHRFTQVRPLFVEVKTYFLLLFIALDLVLITGFRLLSVDPATWCFSLIKLIELRSKALLIKVAGSLDLQLVPSHT